MANVPDRLRVLCLEHLVPPNSDVREFVEGMLRIAKDCGCVWADLDGASAIVLSTRGGDRASVEVPLAKTRLRFVCARLAMWAREHGGGDVNPYGDHAEVWLGPRDEAGLRVQIDFMNTTRSQWFRVEAVGPSYPTEGD